MTADEELGMYNEMTRAELIEQLAALERRLNERFDLIERMLALGFDDTSDQIKLRFGELDVLRARQVPVSEVPQSVELAAPGAVP